MAKTKGSKHSSAETREALRELKSDLKKLGKAVSKQIRPAPSKKVKRGASIAPEPSAAEAAKGPKTKTETSAKKTTKAAKKTTEGAKKRTPTKAK